MKLKRREEISQKINKEVGSGIINKFVVAEKMEANDEEMSIVGWGSKAVPDRDKELIETSAWILEEYRKNPVVMLCHDYNTPPVGKCLWVKSDSQGLRFKCKFANTERGRELYSLYKDGIMNAFSVGFAAIGPQNDNPTGEKYKGLKRVYTKVNLLEISCVPIPSNPEALVDRVKSGKIQTKQLQEELEHVVDLISKTLPETIIEDETKPIVEEELALKIEDNEKNVKVPSLEEIVKENQEEIIKYLQEIGKIEPAVDVNVKMTDPEGNPSIYDIVAAVNKYLNGTVKNMDNCYYSVVDLFPIAYPNGNVIYSCYEEKELCYYRAGYTYDAQMKCAEVDTENGEEVVQSWVFDRYGEIEQEGITKSIEQKEGRVLSGKNIKLVNDCSAKMKECTTALDALIEATNKVVEDENKSIDTEDEEGFEIIPKTIDNEFEIEDEDIIKAISFGIQKGLKNNPISKDDIIELIGDEINKIKGKVVA